MVLLEYFLMILILNGPILTQSTTPPGPETLTGGAVMYEGKLCWSPFTAFKAISRSNNHTCAEGFELTHLNYVETVETVTAMGQRLNKDGRMKERLNGCMQGCTD